MTFREVRAAFPQPINRRFDPEKFWIAVTTDGGHPYLKYFLPRDLLARWGVMTREDGTPAYDDPNEPPDVYVVNEWGEGDDEGKVIIRRRDRNHPQRDPDARVLRYGQGGNQTWVSFEADGSVTLNPEAGRLMAVYEIKEGKAIVTLPRGLFTTNLRIIDAQRS